MLKRVLCLLCFFALPARGKPTHFDMRDAGQRNVVQFVSDGLVEKTIGLSNFISGWVELDPDKLSGVRGEFEVDVRTFNTGIELRNEQFREKWMDAAEFPVAGFAFTRMTASSGTKLVDQQPLTLRMEGNLKAKGQSKVQSILMKLTYFKESELTRQRLPGNLLKMSASFDVDTAQYGVTFPDSIKARFSRYLQVFVDLVGTDQPPSPNGAPPEPPKSKSTK